MKPYFDTSHLVGLLLLIVTMGWGAMELAHTSNSRDGATRAGGGGRRLTVMPVVLAASVMLYLAPRIVPAAAIRPGAAAFAAGMAVLLGGLVLRGWSIKTLGGYFTGRVMVSADQAVITAGPYRLLRHPSYTGLLLACAGAGLTSANWVAVAALVLLPRRPSCGASTPRKMRCWPRSATATAPTPRSTSAWSRWSGNHRSPP